jgi:hypothetical protein
MVRRTGSIRASRKFRRGRSRSLGKRRGSTRRRNTSYRRSRVRRRTQRRTQRRRHIGGAGRTHMHGIRWTNIYARAAKDGGSAAGANIDQNLHLYVTKLREEAIDKGGINGGKALDWIRCTQPADHGPEVICTPVEISAAAAKANDAAAFEAANGGLSRAVLLKNNKRVAEANARAAAAAAAKAEAKAKAKAKAEAKAKAK